MKASCGHCVSSELARLLISAHPIGFFIRVYLAFKLDANLFKVYTIDLKLEWTQSIRRDTESVGTVVVPTQGGASGKRKSY